MDELIQGNFLKYHSPTVHRQVGIKDMTLAMEEVFLNRVWVSTVEFYPLEFTLERCEFQIHFCYLDIQIRPGLHLNPKNFHPCLIACLHHVYLAIQEVIDNIIKEEVIASSLLSLSPQAFMDRHLWTPSFWTSMITKILQCSCCKMRYENFHFQVFVIDFLLLLQNVHLPLQHSLIQKLIQKLTHSYSLNISQTDNLKEHLGSMPHLFCKPSFHGITNKVITFVIAKVSK